MPEMPIPPNGAVRSRKAMDQRSKKSDEPILDFDPVTNSQEPSVKNLSISIESADAAKTVVAAKFDSEGCSAPNVIRYIFVQEDKRWKLDDMTGVADDGKWDLRDIMSPKAAAK